MSSKDMGNSLKLNKNNTTLCYRAEQNLRRLNFLLWLLYWNFNYIIILWKLFRTFLFFIYIFVLVIQSFLFVFNPFLFLYLSLQSFLLPLFKLPLFAFLIILLNLFALPTPLSFSALMFSISGGFIIGILMIPFLIFSTQKIRLQFLIYNSLIFFFNILNIFIQLPFLLSLLPMIFSSPSSMLSILLFLSMRHMLFFISWAILLLFLRFVLPQSPFLSLSWWSLLPWNPFLFLSESPLLSLSLNSVLSIWPILSKMLIAFIFQVWLLILYNWLLSRAILVCHALKIISYMLSLIISSFSHSFTLSSFILPISNRAIELLLQNFIIEIFMFALLLSLLMFRQQKFLPKRFFQILHIHFLNDLSFIFFSISAIHPLVFLLNYIFLAILLFLIVHFTYLNYENLYKRILYYNQRGQEFIIFKLSISLFYKFLKNLFINLVAQLYLYLLLMDKQKFQDISKRPRKKQPCRKQQIDFLLCEKQYGFNDSYCKYYLDQYQTCVKQNSQFYNNF